MTSASSGGPLELTIRWQEAAPDITPRQAEALRTFAATGSVADTAAALDLTPARIYAIFGQVARRLGVSARLVRAAVLDGVIDVSFGAPSPTGAPGAPTG